MPSGLVYATEGEILKFVNNILNTDYETLSQVPTERLERVRLIMEIVKISYDHNITLTGRK